MQALLKREIYGEGLALAIEMMGASGTRVANRWLLGWEPRVRALLATNQYQAAHHNQVELEMDALAEAHELGHLSTEEILQTRGLQEGPPAA